MLDNSSVRRQILLITGGISAAALFAFVLITPAFIDFSFQSTQQEAQLDFFVLVILLVALLSAFYRYLRPIALLAQSTRSIHSLPSDLIQQARTRAHNAPLNVLVAPVIVVGLALMSINLVRFFNRPRFNFPLQLAHSLLAIATCATVALGVSSLTRRFLRPVLIATADLAQDSGRRYEIRLRLAVVVLALNFAIFFFLGVLAFNQVRSTAIKSTADQFRQWADTINQAAPHLDDATLVALITDSDIVSQHHATLDLVSSQGNHLVPAPSHFAPPGTSWEKLANHNGYFTLAFPIERPDSLWRLTAAYKLTPENAPAVRSTLVILLIFGAIVLIAALATVHYLSTDITRDLQYTTARLLEIARHGNVGDRVHTLSLDEVGDLIAAFDKVRQAMMQQQSELGWRVEQMRQLNQASLALASHVDFEQMLDRICQVARGITDSDTVTLLLYNPDDDTFFRTGEKSTDSQPETSVDRFETLVESMTRAVLARQHPILVHDARQHPMVDPAVAESGIRSIIAVPVISRKQVMGVLYVNNQQLDAFNERDVQAVSALASQAAAAIENARLLDETMASAQTLKQRARNLLMINRISTDLTLLLDPYEVFRATARHMVQLMEVDHCSIVIFDAGAAEGIVVAEYPEIGTVGSRIPRTTNPAIERVLTTRQLLAVSDIRQAPLLAPVRDTLEKAGIRAILVAPLGARDEIIGTIGLDVLHQPYTFSQEEQELCSTVAAQAAIAVSNARLLYDLQQQSQALSRKSQELAEESSKLDAILTHMADGLVVTDYAGCIILSNPAFRAIAGTPINQPLRGHLLYNIFSESALRQVIATALDEPDQASVADMELPDGRVLKATASALRTHQNADPRQPGQVAGVITVLRDVTHQVQVDRMKTDFISAVSHELRTPLTSVLGFASLIEREFQRRISPLIADDRQAYHTAERILKNLHIIQSESQRLTRLINDVLDIAKMESGRVEWHMTDVDIEQVVQNAVDVIQNLALEKKLSVIVEFPTSLPAVWGDFDRLVQVMTNLLSNAIKFTERGGITVRGWLWTDPAVPPLAAISTESIPPKLAPPALIVGVSDTGVGIAPDEIPLIFERFRQVGDTLTEKPAGTGLGLPICKEIVSHHSGELWVESPSSHGKITQGEKGSTFFFSLPLSRPPAKATIVPQTDRTSQRIDAPVGQALPDAPLILVVDDEPHIRTLLRQELHNAGYQTIEAADGSAALSLARIMHPDLVILDILMPQVSGLDALSLLRQDTRTADIPIIILSVVDDVGETLELGANAFLTKPIDQVQLLHTINTLLDGPDSKKSS